MNILYISGEGVPGSDGGAVHVYEVASSLAKLGNKVTVLCARRCKQPKRESLGGFSVVRARMGLLGKTFPILAIAHLPRLLMGGWDIIIERYVTFGGVGVIVSVLTGVPLVLEVNSPHVEELIWRLGIRSTLLRKMLRARVGFMFRRAALAISTLRSIVPREGRGKTKLVAWAANIQRFRPELRSDRRCLALRKRYGLIGKKVVLFLGTFRAWHGALRIPDIAQKVTTLVPKVVFLLVGKGECLEEIRSGMEEKDLSDKVVFAGEQAYEEVPLFIAASDVGIAPYDLDAYPPLKKFGFYWSPLKIFEFMAAGLPVVTIDVPPLNEVVEDGVRGRTAPYDNVDKIADAIVWVLRNDARRHAMGRRAREHIVQRYSWAAHTRQLLQYLLEVKR